ncbi:MAG: (2Fe-2S) ferredoxin domain-containing protein [Nitrospirae bacterium]|nr:(2Fe-2S) ferredoxin domain-containing protein [Nitrospirota bacterium]
MPRPEKIPFDRVIFVCVNERPAGEDACAPRGSKPLQEELKAYAKSKGLKGRLRVSRVMCLGQCALGPNIAIMPDNVWYHRATKDDLAEIKRRFIDPLANG